MTTTTTSATGAARLRRFAASSERNVGGPPSRERPENLSERPPGGQPQRGEPAVRTQLWFWVLVAIAAGIVFGLVAPGPATDAKWLADAFLQLIKTVTAPVIFVTVVIGISSLGGMARAGGAGPRAPRHFLAPPAGPPGLR